MYHITLLLNVEWSASLLSHPFSLNFLTLGFCFPQPHQRVFSLSNMAAAGPKPMSKLSIWGSREKSREIVAHSLAARFASLLRACSRAQGFHQGTYVSKGVFERCTSTGSGLFTFLSSCIAQIFSWIVSTCVKKLSNINVIASRHIKREKFSLPFDVGLSKAAY